MEREDFVFHAKSAGFQTADSESEELLRVNGFTHLDSKGNAVMVDISDKEESERTARAAGRIIVSGEALAAVTQGNVPKGDVFAAARIAGIMAAKRTPELIPLCHTLLLTKINIDFDVDEKESSISCTCLVKLKGRTGAEMEALTGVSAALLTIYDMLKAIDKYLHFIGAGSLHSLSNMTVSI